MTPVRYPPELVGSLYVALRDLVLALDERDYRLQAVTPARIALRKATTFFTEGNAA